jgi:hypothetical protein
MKTEHRSGRVRSAASRPFLPPARFVRNAAPTSIFIAGSPAITPFQRLMTRTRNQMARASRARPRFPSRKIICKSLDLTLRTMSDFAIHLTADIIGEADPLATFAAKR